MVDQITKILKDTLPKESFILVQERKGAFGGQYIQIAFAPNDTLINGVRGQFPQVVSLSLDVDTLELEPQMYGGCGGNRIERKPNLNDDKEKYLAMKSVKVPFRKPKKDLKYIMPAIERFAQNYLKTLRDNKENLMYSELVDYDKYLN